MNENGGAGDDISARARMKAADGDDGRVHGRGQARRNRLQRLNERAGADDCVDAFFRHRAVTSAAGDREGEHIAARGDAAGGDVHRAGFKWTPDVNAEEGVDVVDQTGFEHLLRAELAFLGGLKDELDRAGEIDGVENFRRAQQSGDVRVVTAGVHHAGILR